MRRADRIEPRAIEWLWMNRIPRGMVTIVAGRPGQGKSAFAIHLAAAVTRQGESVILSNQEDLAAEVLVPRLMAAGADMKRIFMPSDPYLLPGALVPPPGASVGELEKKVKQTNAKLLILDSAAQHLAVSIHNDQEVRKAMTPLTKMLERLGVACVLVTHTVKHVSASSHPLEAIGGAGGGMVGAARLVYIFGPDPKQPDLRVLAPVKSNVGPIATGVEFTVEVEKVKAPKKGGRLTFDIVKLTPVSNASTVSAASIARFSGSAKNAADDGTDVTRLAMAEEWLTGLLMKGPMKMKEVEDEAGKVKVSWATVRRAADSIQVSKSRHGFGANGFWQWELPDGHPLKPVAEGDGDGDLDAEFAKLLEEEGESK